MNQDHAIAGVSGVSATALLTTVLQHFQAIDPATAAAEAGLIVMAAGIGAALIQMLLARRTPSAIVPSVWSQGPMTVHSATSSAAVPPSSADPPHA